MECVNLGALLVLGVNAQSQANSVTTAHAARARCIDGFHHVFLSFRSVGVCCDRIDVVTPVKVCKHSLHCRYVIWLAMVSVFSICMCVVWCCAYLSMLSMDTWLLLARVAPHDCLLFIQHLASMLLVLIRFPCVNRH